MLTQAPQSMGFNTAFYKLFPAQLPLELLLSRESSNPAGFRAISAWPADKLALKASYKGFYREYSASWVLANKLKFYLKSS